MVKKIQGYTLHECIGKGSSGEVFKATHSFKEGQFAIKVIDNQLLHENPKAEECLLNQVTILSKIGYCENIVSFHELIKTKNNHYFVYDFCNGGNLYEWMKKVKRIPQIQVIKYTKDILNAFKVLNKHKVLHRDLKPENILFHNGKLKLADFGLCKGLKPEEHMTKTMLGSPIYMAPEVLKAESYTSKADIWSLGVIIFEMLYGFCPFRSSSIAALTSKIETSPLEFPETPATTEYIKQVLKKMLNKGHYHRIGWLQLFNQFFPQQDQTRQLKIEQRYSKRRSQSKSKHKSKKPSLCLIDNNPLANLIKQFKSDEDYNRPPEKQNRLNFNSSKYMTMMNKNEERRPKRISNFRLQDQQCVSSPRFRDFEPSQPASPTGLKNNSLPLEFVNMSAKNSPKRQPSSPGPQQNIRQFIIRLQNIHEEFVKISPYCQTMLQTKSKENIRDILQFLCILKQKFLQLSREFSKIKKRMCPEHDDLQTMIKYQIIGIENTMEQICTYTGDRMLRSYGQNGFCLNSWSSSGYKFKSYAIEKVCARINQMKI